MRDEITRNDAFSTWRSGRLTVLVADDEPEIRDCLRILLEGEGYKVITTDNGYSALGILQEFGDCIDVLLLDMNMPIMDGDWVLREMKARRHRVPVVVHSGMGPEEIRLRCKDAEIHSVLPKPSSSANIIKAVVAASVGDDPTAKAGKTTSQWLAKDKGLSA